MAVARRGKVPDHGVTIESDFAESDLKMIHNFSVLAFMCFPEKC